MKTPLTFVCDADDLWDPSQIETLLCPIKSAIPDFRITLYSIPNKLGPVHDLVKEYPWILFAIHGWEHTHFECLTWTAEDTVRFVEQALDMGYSPLFKPPNWQMDFLIEEALLSKAVALHCHESYTPTCPGLQFYRGPSKTLPRHVNLHSHITPNPATDDISSHPGFRPENLKNADRFEFVTSYLRSV